MYKEDELLPISAITHFAYCERRCALVLTEQIWMDNRFTAEGNILHEKTHKEETETRGDCRIARGLYIHCLSAGLYGKADVVEFHKSDTGIRLPNVNGLWIPYPVEYKHGKPKSEKCDEIQLCAQALCLEEMLGIEIVEGALFYGTTRRRELVIFDTALREITLETIAKLHKLISSRQTPPAIYQKKCDNCSLVDMCVPKIGNTNTAGKYLNEIMNGFEKEYE